MAIDKNQVLAAPVLTATLRPDNTGELRVDGTVHRITGASDGEALQALIALMQAEAARLGGPVRVTTRAQTGVSVLLVGVDGTVEEESYTPNEELDEGDGDESDDEDVDVDVDVDVDGIDDASDDDLDDDLDDDFDDDGASSAAYQPVSAASPALVTSAPTAFTPITFAPAASAPAATPAPAPAPATPSLPASTASPDSSRTPATTVSPADTKDTMSNQTQSRDLRDAPSFLAAPSSTEPAQQGFAGFLNHIGFHLAPGRSEQSERRDIEEVTRRFDARRTVTVINRKGGANKTPTVVNLAAVFGRYGGGSVLAWDNNETMGTLGWRTEQGTHESTVLDVIDSADALLSSEAEFGQMSTFVHHQPADKFDVLRSDEDIAGTHEVTAAEVDLVHRVAAKYYRLIFMDSGNSDRAENWLRMIDHTDQLVVPTTTMEDRAQAALLTLQAVQTRSEKAAELARNAVVVVSEWQPKESSISQRMADEFRPYVRDVVIVPFDPALKAGRIQHAGLQPATRRAWLAAAAAVARGL